MYEIKYLPLHPNKSSRAKIDKLFLGVKPYDEKDLGEIKIPFNELWKFFYTKNQTKDTV